MDETVIVIMQKDPETGFLDKELGSYKITENEDLIYNTYAMEQDGRMVVTLKLTCEREVEDWEYEAIFDYYDQETILPFVTSIEEDLDCYNPTWKVSFDFLEDIEEMEKRIGNLLKLHRQELDSVYTAIADKRNEYKENENEPNN